MTSCRHCACCALSRRHRASAHFVEQHGYGGPGHSRAGGTGRGRHVYLVGGDMESTPRRLVPIILGALFALPALLAAQEPVTITGKVTSDAGQPLAQVEVAIPTMGLGGLTKDDGSYVIVVPGARVSGQTVTAVARRLGYKSQTAQVTLTPGGVKHDFTLAANPLQLGEVVVTGAGTSSSTEKLGSVRNSVSSDLIQKAGESNVVQALAAKAPNVTVLQQSGDPGAGSFINIRGVNSILGPNQPLFIIDGVPMDNSAFSTSNFNRIDDNGGTNNQFGQTEGTVVSNRALDLNPNDIEAVEILKGPAASAIYGSRAGAGVMIGPNNHFSRTALRFKGSHRLVDNLKVGADLAYADSRGSFIQRGNNTNGVQLGDLRQPPEFNPLPYSVNTAVGPQERGYRF